MGRLNKIISIRAQLTWVIFTAILILLLTSVAVFLYAKANDLHQQHSNHANTLAKVLAQDFTRVILLNEQDVVNDMVYKISSFNDITHAGLITRDGTAVLNFTREGFQPVNFIKPDKRHAPTELELVEIPIRYADVNYGSAYFYFRDTSFERKFIAFVTKLWYIAPLLLFISFVISLLAQNYFTRPIRELSDAVNSMKDGAIRTLDLKYAHSKEMSELFQGFQNMAEQINDAGRTIAEQKERLHVMLESIADGVIATDTDNTIIYLNPAAEHILNIKEENTVNKPVSEVFPLLAETSEENIDSILDETIMTGEVHINLKDASIALNTGETIPVQSTVSPIRDSHGNISGTIIVFQNVSEARELADKLHHQATHDPLTGLINRAEFERQLQKLINNSHDRTQHALMYLDLDQFKLVNDTSGHTAGDALLIQLAGQFQGILREHDLIARLGGDEFAILLESCDLQRANTIAENIIEKFKQFSFIWDERHFKIGVSIGLVPIDHNLISPDELLRDADLACYAAKDAGRNRVHIYRSEDTLLVQRHNEMQWANLIRDAIDKDNLCLYAQHIRAMDHNNKINHFEVLVRYNDASDKLHPPANFLSAVERYGLAPLLDRWVIKNVLHNETVISELRSNRNIRVNINLSGHTLSEPDLVDYVAVMLAHAKLPPRTICFEITETAAVTNLSATAHFMKKMRLLGCEFALDDFGSGVSSFAYLKNLPIDYLKIDGNFVKDIHNNLINRAMVAAINDIGHVMNIKTIAEYVTNPAVCEVLQAMDIDFAQGYFVHAPCPIAQIFQNIHRSNALDVCAHTTAE